MTIDTHQIKAILFDMDDTLFHSSVAYERALKEVGLSETHELYRKARTQVKDRLGKGHVSSHHRLLYFKELLAFEGKLSSDQVLNLIERYEYLLCSEIQSQWKQLAREKLISTLSKNFKLAIVTNETTRTQLLKLRSVDPDGSFFPIIVTSEEVGCEKPSFAPFELAIQRLGIKAENCLMVGDSFESDIVPALQLGMQAVRTREFCDNDIPSMEGVIEIDQLEHLLPLLKLVEASPHFFSLCTSIGAEVPFWIQGAGGNISEKDGDRLWIKASGMRLDSVSRDKGIACLALDGFLNALEELNLKTKDAEQYYSDTLKKYSVHLNQYSRPSMEAGFHAVLPAKWICHFHSLTAILMCHVWSSDQERFCSWWKLATQDSCFQTFCVIPPYQPGLELSHAVRDKADNQTILLQNHGVILQLSDVSELEKWRKIEAQFHKDWNYPEWKHISSEPFTKPETFKFYMPDTALFSARISKLLEKIPTGADIFDLDIDKLFIKEGQDALELLRASCLLEKADKSLIEIPLSISSTIHNLPTEIFRKELKNT
jgi:putative hydrolase of the HAD superfamily